ncbi:MAG: hypothetical protein KAI55_04015 [Candidatus Aenigmarchaeota archaeon]|nr:hypothetical protein [Candidatus Aenigmarchaeota archaeon]
MDIKSFFNIDETIQELKETKIMRWKYIYFLVKVFTILILLTIIISPKISAILMFALVALVSRIPSVLASPLKDSEMIDFFAVILALCVSPLFGAIFAVAIFCISTFFSSLELKPQSALINSPALFFPCFFMPWAYAYFGGNLLYTMYVYTAIRYAIRLPTIWLVKPDVIMISILFYTPCNLVLAYFTNTIHVFLFGTLTTKIISEGLAIDINLLILIILMIAFFEVAKIFEKRMKNKKTPIDDKFGFFPTIRSSAKSLFFFSDKKTIRNMNKAKKDMLDYISILLKKLKSDDYKKLDILKDQLMYLKDKTEEINNFTIKENIKQLNSIASLLPKIEILSFKEIKGIYEISNRYPEFSDIYNNTKGKSKRPIEIIAKSRIVKNNSSNEFSSMFSITKQDDKNSVIIEIDIVRIVINRAGEEYVAFEVME